MAQAIDQSQRDRRTMYPQDERVLLDWYKGAFDAAFIALHPFYDPLPMAPYARGLLEKFGLAANEEDPFELVATFSNMGVRVRFLSLKFSTSRSDMPGL